MWYINIDIAYNYYTEQFILMLAYVVSISNM